MPFNGKNPQIPDFSKMVNQFLKAVEKPLEATSQTFMEGQLKAFKKRIKDQDFQSFHAEPLSPAYRAKKRRLGLPLSTMIATGTYLEAIKLVKKAKSGGIDAWIIQVDPKAKAVDMTTGEIREDITVAEVAYINEHGSNRLVNQPPPRPHWAPFVVAFGMAAETRRKSIANLVKAQWNAVMKGS